MEPILIISTVLALLIGSGLGYACFRYMLTGKYHRTIKAAEKQSEVLIEKKLLEVREKFLNKKNELERETQQRNQKLQ
ncbi:MAG: ribonuclease Y, partial [Alloprevotella tannerae]|nr:ribonuclease Y [Alloprevotella tannerae]